MGAPATFKQIATLPDTSSRPLRRHREGDYGLGMRKRRIRIDVTCDDDQYMAIANMLWHALEFSKASDFNVHHDGKQTDQQLNDYWDDLGSGSRWTT